MRQFIRWFMIIGSVTATIYKYRYKALDIVTRVPVLRKLLVRLSMNVPWIRHRFLSQMFRGL
ncbi:hypothetical protein SAMN05192559_102264 [Halobacillus karajensis]|uniref:Uncharacterized protein n=1 Tax=Halobacillus karajensis TaxID=195088 RepID=A0A024P6E1_9BACI|nr:hypothetical protein [Halobacillus karajensis]CDQ17999.1 hypothetical protein BN982_00239 [Halobacillus karajensis]CDQ24348.1 hypothetical protein BN983_02622 [Halobacillus karajensis]CDQ29403.1 hypothetical protein BN981_03784 [Halobacillus karajensis]SEH61214.1 hypothetical protein SAMN05192559_102264 [Halobacillus karajensis]